MQENCYASKILILYPLHVSLDRASARHLFALASLLLAPIGRGFLFLKYNFRQLTFNSKIMMLKSIIQEFSLPLRRPIYTSSGLSKNTRSGVIRRTRNMSEALTYEQSKKPHQISVLKSWNSWNTSNIHGEDHYTGILTFQDSLIRLFIRGTFPTHVLSEVRWTKTHCYFSFLDGH